MKQSYLFLFALLLMIVACGGDDGEGGAASGGSEYLNVSNVDITGDRTTATLNIQASPNCEWTISWSDSWIRSVTPSSGRGNQSITITVDVNPSSTSSRAAHLAVKNTSGTISRDITITQYPSDVTLSVSPLSLEFLSDAGSQNIHVNCNNTWSIGGYNEWCHVNQTSGNGSTDIIVSVDENTNEITRGPIILTISTSTGQTLEVSVVQKGIPTLNAVESEKEVPAVGGVCMISVTGNADWTVNSESSWAHISEENAQGTGSGQVSVNCDDNLDLSVREAKIVFHWSRESIKPVVVTIRQQAATLPVLSNMSVTPTGTNEITVTAHYESSTFPITEYGVCYDSSPNSTIENGKISFECSAQSGDMSVEMKNLEANKTYYLRVYAKSKVGITYSEESAFELQEKRPGTDDNQLPNYARKRKNH